MAIAGALAGLAGATQISGVLGRATRVYRRHRVRRHRGGVLGRSHPVGILLAGLLFGALEAGGRQMQVDAGVSIDLIGIIQALIIIFVAAPLLVRRIFPPLFRERARKDPEMASPASGQGGCPASPTAAPRSGAVLIGLALVITFLLDTPWIRCRPSAFRGRAMSGPSATSPCRANGSMSPPRCSWPFWVPACS